MEKCYTGQAVELGFFFEARDVASKRVGGGSLDKLGSTVWPFPGSRKNEVAG